MDKSTGDPSEAKDKQVLIALQSGQVQVSGRGGDGGSPALIRPGQGITVLINGQEISEAAEVTGLENIKVQPLEEITAERVEIRLSNEQLQAEARYLPGCRKYYQVSDHPFTDHLVIEGIRREEQIKTLTPADILKRLEEEQVRYGIDREVLNSLFDNPDNWIKVAAGDPVQQGQNGWVEPLFEGGVKSVTYGEEEERVDYRKRFEIEQVNSGDVIARIHPPVPGRAGKTVTGDEINPDPVSPVEVNCESGSTLNGDGSAVIATRKGIPSFKKGRLHSFRVDDIYLHKGDVDIKSGNIRFRGHFKVQGEVTEGMKVTADGNIEIGGNASAAEILAGGSIVFKGNCIKCKVQAGWVDLVLKDLYRILEDMLGNVENALEAANEVVAALEARNKFAPQMEAAVVRALLQGKYADLPGQAGKLQQYLKEMGKSMPELLLQTIVEVTPHFVDYQYSQALGRPVLGQIRDKLATAVDAQVGGSDKADITAPYIQNSVVNCTGDMIVSGNGVYNSQLKCGGTVNVAKLFRGGIIEAGEDVYIGEAGTPRITAEQGMIQVPYNGRVHLGAVYENVRVRFGTTDYRFDKNLNNIRVILDQHEFEVKILHWGK